MKIRRDEFLALASGLLVEIVLGSLYTFGAITPYIYSYLYYCGGEVSLVALSILFTTAIIMMNVGMVFSTWLSKWITNQITCGISVILVGGSVFIASYMKSFAGFVIFYGIVYGLSIGIGYLPPVKNAYLHLPHRKGLCAGICMTGFGLGSVIFNQIIVMLINPNDVKADSTTKHFPEDIANNVPYALKILAAVYAATGILAVIFIRPPKKMGSEM